MNQYEQLIEFIINEQEDKARELFHQIVVEKSREIYENLIDENDFDESVHGDQNQIEDLVNDIQTDSEGLPEAEGEIDDEEMDMGDEMDDGEMDDEEMDMGDEGDEMDDGGSDSSQEDRIMDLESALDELKAEFDKLVAGEEAEEGDHPGIHDMGGDDMDDDMGSDSDMVREYVEKVANGHGAEKKGTAEGGEVGHNGSVAVNKQSIVAGKNNMGGSSANIARGGAEQSPDGKQFSQPSNAYSKGKGNLPGAGNYENVPGAKTKGYTNKSTSYEKQHGKEGQTTDGKMPVSTKSLVGGKIR